MSITGNLKTMELAELLQWLSQSQKTGTLVIDDGRVTKQVYFRTGRIISSASTDPKEHLGHFLVSHSLISEKELAKAMEMQDRTKMLLGKILVTIGALDETVLHRLLRLKAEESIYDIFTWSQAEFRFLDDELPTSTMIPIDLDITMLTLEGVRRLDEWKRIREVIPSMHAIPVSLTDLDDPSHPQRVRQVLGLVDDARTIEEICLQTHSSEFFVCRVLFDELQGKRLKVVRPRGSKPPAIPPPVPGGGPHPGAGTIGARALIGAARDHLEYERYEQALRHLRAARSLEPENREIQVEVEESEHELRGRLEAGGIKMTAVPKLASNLEDLTASKITPQEGFMLTRINGSYDLQSIVKISPMPPLDALVVFWRLLKAGHVTLEEKEKGKGAENRKAN
jgi:Domain of unknown function (DUF4388)